jgi:hypothetical protein
MGTIPNTTDDERLAKVLLKVARAEKHIVELRAALQAFYDTKPYEVASRPEPETGRLRYYVTKADPVPPEIAAILGDIFHNLRSALDHLAQQLYFVGSGRSTARRKTCFLITETAKGFKAEQRDAFKEIRQDAIDAICALEPYSDGKGADLWVLHKLNIIDKHRLILTIGSAFRSMNLGPTITRHISEHISGFSSGPFFVRPADRKPLRVGDLIAGDVTDPEFRFEVTVPGVIEGESVLETVDRFRQRVRKVVESFKPYLS